MKIFHLTLWVIFFIPSVYTQTPEKPNIVYIFIDDLNDYTQVFDGQPQSVTPSIAGLAAQGTVFLNAFANSTKCMPSRHSMISGKDLAYTQLAKNESCQPFRDFFTEEEGNPWVYTLAEVLKDSAGYFTYGINKFEHCFDQMPDYDSITLDACSKELSWNKFFYIPGGESYDVNVMSASVQEGTAGFSWYKVPDSMETQMLDYVLIDSALDFVNAYESDPSIACERPLFMMLGLRKPHLPWFIPEHYFQDAYITDFYAEPYPYPYNFPEQAFPFNGVVMPEQPAIKYGDFYAFPDTGLARVVSDAGNTHSLFEQAWNSLDVLPEIDGSLTEEERKAIIGDSYRANAMIAYLAAVQFVDAQIGRFIDSLQTNYPEFYNNTVFITTSDHGYSFGEKRTWKKGTLWESDIRVPLIINDMRAPNAQVVHDVVGLIDLFPTMLDFAESPVPMINDTTPYLDGVSLFPYMENPNLQTERGIVSGIRVNNYDCSCFPQFSVRTDRFHYIYYTSNNDAFFTLPCHANESFHEEELYEIGVERETDPNEWNNLINNEEYAPLHTFMQSFLPDSTNYQQVLYKTSLSVNSPECVPDRNSGVRIKASLFNTEGLAVSPMDYANYTFTWTNSLTNDTLTGYKLTFPFFLIDSAVYAANDHILFYLDVKEIVSGRQVAFDLKKVFMNPASIPEIDFSLSASDSSILINDVSITGTYSHVEWLTSSGYSGIGLPPTPLFVDGPGPQTIKGTVFYGNRSTCKVSSTRSITIMDPPLRQLQMTASIRVIPNPANQKLTLEWSSMNRPTSVFLHNMNGELMYTSDNLEGDKAYINSSGWPAGIYTISSIHASGIERQKIVIVH